MTLTDLALEELAAAEAELKEANRQLLALVESLAADVGIYRELTQAAFDALRAVTLERRHVAEERDRLREENRRLREEYFLRLDLEPVDGVGV